MSRAPGSFALVEAQGLRVEYRGGGRTVTAVRDVDLDIHQGETLALVGESGCGKSTLGRALLRAERPAAGRILFRGADITSAEGTQLRSVRAEMQMVFQDPFSSLNPRRRVADIVAEPLRRARRQSRREAAVEVDRLLDLVGLGRAAGGRRPHEFSGGQRQRIGIARALASSPQFVVADEPVSALDVSIQAQVVNLLDDLRREAGLTLLFISHDLGVVRHIADRIAVMYLGEIVETADRSAFFAAPAHPYSGALLSAVPVVDPAARRERVVLTGDLPDPSDPPPGCLFSTRCPRVQARCRVEHPALVEHEPGRAVRCHFPLTSAPAQIGAP